MARYAFLFDAYDGAAQGTNAYPLQPYVTEIDLRHSLIPDEVIEHLVQTMPPHEGPDLMEDRDLPKYDYISFMEKLMENNNDGISNVSANGD